MPDHNTLHEPSPWQPEQDPVALAKHINDVSNAARYEQNPDAQATFNGYLKRHDAYLTGVAKQVEQAAQAPQSGMRAQSAATETSSVFTFADTKINPYDRSTRLEGAPLDPTRLGLPSLPDTDFRPMGVMIQKGPDGIVTGVSAFGRREKDGYHQQYMLENYSEVRTPGSQSNPRWVSPGDALLSQSVDAKTTTEKNEKSGKGFEKLTVIPATEDGTVTLVRTAPTKTERELMQPVKGYKKRLVAGAALSAFALGSLFGHSDPENSLPVNSGIEMVAQPNTAPDGIEQASSLQAGLGKSGNFSPKTIQDARTAFDSYFAGDRAGLQQQAEALGYHNEWISPDKLAAVDQAQTMGELEQAANKALAGSPVHFTIIDSQDRLHMLDGDRNEEISTPATDLGNTRATVEDALDVINTFSIKNLHDQVGPLDMAFVGDIQTVGDMKEAGGADGYTKSVQNATRILIATGNTKSVGQVAKETTVGHELTHAEDFVSGSMLSKRVSDLNPADYSYQNPGDSYSIVNDDAPIFDHGNQVVNEPYGAINLAEDTATVGQNLDVPNPTIDVNRSPFQQKEVELLLSEEQQQPGFIASMLSRARSVGMPGPGNRLQKAWNNAEWPVRTIGIASLVLGAALLRKKRVARQTRDTYGAGPQ